MKTIREIKDEIDTIDNLDDERIAFFMKDGRKGVTKLVHQRIKSLENLNKLKIQHQERQRYEKNLINNGFSLIAGVDEVGRGPLAGPVVTAAVILPEEKSDFIGINDSKTLSHTIRSKYATIIKEKAVAYSISVIDNNIIDELNIYVATQLCMKNAIEELEITPEYILVDAMHIDTEIPQQAIIKGDQQSISIAAASIIAKEYRDQMMKDYAKIYPAYSFEQNMGYGTKAHLLGLEINGYCDIHRKSFEPIKTMYKNK